MVIRNPKEKAEELRMLKLFSKSQLIKEIIFLRRDNKRQHTMIKNLYTNKKQHDNKI